MGHIDYKEIYALQDEVFRVVFKTENLFYLTGGTCLSRFYFPKRYSDDLDFFADGSPRYAFAVRTIKRRMLDVFSLKVEVESKDFTRWRINEQLQVDFINEHSPRYKDVIVTPLGYVIDNIENILCNKITAVVGRDDPKDVFDIYLIWKYHSFSWNDILQAALKKAFFSIDDLIVRLKTFPRNLLERLDLLDPAFLDPFDAEFPRIINEIRAGSDHERLLSP